jgi:DUF4097 and DUF4098 domain-containing protein YvlB
MASSTVTPPPAALPPQAPPPPRRRSFAGPVVLITIGVVFLLGNMGVLGWRNIGELFARYWPLLLIIWGLIKLFEYWHAQREGYRASGIGVGGVFLIIFVIILGSAATGVWKYGGALGDREWEIDGEPICFGICNKYTFTSTQERDFPAGSSLRVVNERGDVKLTASNDNKVHVVTNSTAIASSQDEADKMNQARQPKITIEGTVVIVDSTGTGGVTNANRARVNMEIQVPRKAAADIMTLRGDVHVIGRDGDVKAESKRGDVQIEDVNGKVEAHLRRSGDITASKITGDVSIEGSISDCTVSDIGGQVELRGDYYGSIQVSRVPKPVRFQSSRTDLEIAHLDGSMTMESGDLRVSSLAGPVTLRTRSKEVHFESFSGDLTLDDSNGEVEVRVTKLPVGNIDISNRNGPIRLTLPEKGAFSADAQTRNGEIHTDFGEVRIETVRDNTHGTGRVGNGTNTVRLRTEHGDIEIRKGSTP